jgi:Erv1 / Alr family
MSPPEVWGPPIWTLFHTLAEKINPSSYPYISKSLFEMIVRICKYLPCPECSNDASNFLAKININNYKTKEQFKNMLYLFHNYVNNKKRKQLYNHQYMDKYRNLNLLSVIKNFISKYNTKGNMKLLADSFQRSLVISDFTYWFKLNYMAFVNTNVIKNLQQRQFASEKNDVNHNNNPIQEPIVKEDDSIIDLQVHRF